MATLREYFETDFNQTRIDFVCSNDKKIQGILLYDFIAHASFIALYISNITNIEDYIKFINHFASTRQIELTTPIRITAPKLATKNNGDELRLSNREGKEPLVEYKFSGGHFISAEDLLFTSKYFIYSEHQLNEKDVLKLIEEGKKLKLSIEFRSSDYVKNRMKNEKPVAFISYDYRDRELTRKIANELRGMRCSVWYDEFSIKPGDSLRESIEKGIKECKKCILILSQYYLANNSRAKNEFTSIFTKQIIEAKNVVIPIWLDVKIEDVYAYSPSLLNIAGLKWKDASEDENIRKLYSAINQLM